MFTSRHFIHIAETIRNLDLLREQREEIARAFADRLAATNSQFNRKRFIEAAMVSNEAAAKIAFNRALAHDVDGKPLPVNTHRTYYSKQQSIEAIAEIILRTEK